jgi:transcriptional regulator GlxA family with amidase domain
MNRRFIAWGGIGVVALGAVGGGAWILSLPSAPRVTDAPPIPKEEADAALMALKPPKRQRPLIAIIAINDATEVTDYLVPFGILRRADVADVVPLATGPGTVKLYPALEVEPHGTIATFDAQHPEGADYVIVPAMSRDDDATALRWLRGQAAKGATIIGVCAGAKVVGEAGLLDGKRATTHWYYRKELRRKHPTIRYVADRRLVVDRGVATTTGITASMPTALNLIEAIAGRGKAEAVGRDIGLPHWDARHDSDAFQFARPFALTAIRNTVALWSRERLGIELTPGIDEVSLALVADAWSRTYRSRAVTFSRTDGAQWTRNGIRIVPDRVVASWPGARRLPALRDRRPARALDEALDGIEARYGTRTADFVATQLEYPRRSRPAAIQHAPAGGRSA